MPSEPEGDESGGSAGARLIRRIAGQLQRQTPAGGVTGAGPPSPTRLLLFLGLALLLWPLLVAAGRATLRSPPATAILLDRDGRFLAEVGRQTGDYGYWPVGELPERVVAATLALEDRRYWEHPGVDPRGVARAIGQNLAAGERISGASTIAMQVARMMDPGPRSYPRKLVEALTALMLTARYGREELMRHYLRIVPTGQRARGMAYAARIYLDKPLGDLSWAETAFLCALPQAPSRMSPYSADGRVRAIARGQRILTELRGAGLLDEVELEAARAELERLRFPPRPARPTTAMHAILLLEQRWKAGDLGAEPMLRTTLDLPLQEQLSRELRQSLALADRAGARQAALVVLEPRSGALRALVGSAGYFDAEGGGATDYSRLPRSPGSALKPFLYAAALDRGLLRPDSILDDLARSPEGIGNADGRYLGPLLPRLALANSRNVPAVALLRDLGLGPTSGLLRDLGLHQDEVEARHYGAGLAIGGLPVRLLDLASAATALADDGRRHPLLLREGGLPQSQPVFSPAAARLVSLQLADPSARLPTFARMGPAEYPWPVALKTGSSTDHRDSVAIAWTDRLVVAAWMGHPDQRAMRGLSGMEGAARLLRPAVLALHSDASGAELPSRLAPPEGWSRRALCSMSGQGATPHCERSVEEWLPADQGALEPCSVHRLVERPGQPPRVEVQLPARYLSFLAQRSAEPPAALASAEPQLQIISPAPDSRYLIDPNLPPEHSTLALRATVDPPAGQLLWVVDGRPFQLVDPPYEARWPVSPGRHRIQVGLPHQAKLSAAVVVELR